MRIKNLTNYDTKQLKTIMAEQLKEQVGYHKGYEVTLVYRRKGNKHIAGFGFYYKPVIKMKLPKKQFSLKEFIMVFQHEIAHTLNVRHERGEKCLMSAHYTPAEDFENHEMIKESQR